MTDRPRFTDSIGVSAIVRTRTDSTFHKAGSIGMVIGQSANGRDRYQVMFPGDPNVWCPLAADLEVVQGIDLDGWWQRGR